MSRTKTINLQGKDYAQVVERIKKFREENPRGDITTEPTIMEDGQVMFKAIITKDKADQASASATGHSIGMNKGVKAFEKLETIAVGRGLALLGYAADGEIASAEEMEEFESYKKEQAEALELAIAEAVDNIGAIKDLEILKQAFIELPPQIRGDKRVYDAKEANKKELSK